MTGSGITPTVAFEAALSGDRTSLARLLSMVERGGAEAREISRVAHAHTGRAATVGITGAPGAGKSTLTSALVRALRVGGESVAVLAIDPSSPFTGGAILGDRVRMGEHALDDGVYIRSMATRGHLGGLAVAVPDAARVLDAVGFARIVIETVGVGQVEVEVAGEADTTVVVVNPGWGDAVQANKAGLMEIADVFVVNKADRPGAAATVDDLDRMLMLRAQDGWRPPVIATVATTGDGVEALADAIDRHHRHLVDSDALATRRAARAEAGLRRTVAAVLASRVDALATGDEWTRLCTEIEAGRLDPWTAAVQLTED
jgi:LAO/AO transport system kinase